MLIPFPSFLKVLAFFYIYLDLSMALKVEHLATKTFPLVLVEPTQAHEAVNQSDSSSCTFNTAFLYKLSIVMLSEQPSPHTGLH